MTADRTPPTAEPLTATQIDHIRRMLSDGTPTMFDPEVVAGLLAIIDEAATILAAHGGYGYTDALGVLLATLDAARAPVPEAHVHDAVTADKLPGLPCGACYHARHPGAKCADCLCSFAPVPEADALRAAVSEMFTDPVTGKPSSGWYCTNEIAARIRAATRSPQ